MATIGPAGAIGSIGQMSRALEAAGVGGTHQAREVGGSSFAQMLGGMIDTTNAQQVAADRAIVGLATGQVTDVHEAIIAAEKARISLEILAEMRNKLVASYQEIMRMQI